MGTPKSKSKIMNTESQGINNTDPLSSLRDKLKTADLEIQNYVTALEAHNFKLTKEIAKFQVENVTLKNRVKSLVEQNEKDTGTALIEAMSRAGEQLRKRKAYSKNEKGDK